MLLKPSTLCFDPASARQRIFLTYLYRHKRAPNLENPSRFTELVQWRKLHERDPGHSALLDKLDAKEFAKRLLGPEWLVPTAWSGKRLDATCRFSLPAIVKARHGCNQNRVLLTEPSSSQWSDLRQTTRRWTALPYGLWLDEWAYRDVPRGLLAEPLLGQDATLPLMFSFLPMAGRTRSPRCTRSRALTR